MHVKSPGPLVKNGQKIYSWIFRDGSAGQYAKKRFRERRRKLMKRKTG